MTPDRNSGIDGEVIRVEAVTYLQGSVGHATASLVCILLGGVLLWAGHWGPGLLFLVGACALSMNGASVWGWDRLQAFFSARTRTDDGEPTRALEARPFSSESLVDMKVGAVMVASFVGILLIGDLARRLFDLWVVGVATVAVVGVGNVVVLVRTYYSRSR